MEHENYQNLLEGFIVDNDALERLESKIASFNIFEAIGAVRYELRHSDFLAFLMDPSDNHGLNDTFTKKLLKDITYTTEQALEVSAVDIDVMNADKLEVRREWRNIDILLIDWDQRNVIAFENKIDSSEGEGQLETYSGELSKSFKGFNTLKVFLTPEGDIPNEDDDWIPYSYENIAKVLSKVIKLEETVLSNEVLSLLKHYNEILRRHILENSDIKELCRKIYHKHSQALDLIFEHKPDQRLEISNYLKDKVEEHGFNLYDYSKSRVRFSLDEWDQSKSQMKGKGDGDPDKVLLLWFKNETDRLYLTLIICPSPDQNIRKYLFETAKDDSNSLNPTGSFSDSWKQIHRVDILSEKQLIDFSFKEIKEHIDRFFTNKLKKELKDIQPVFTEAFEKLDEEISL